MRLALLLLICSQAWGAACVASVTGNWHDAATWGGTCAGAGTNGTPGSGDTGTVSNGVTLTCDVAGGTCVIGSSPADDTGTPALACTTSSTGTGVFNIAAGASFTYKGPMRGCNATWTWGAGATITYDASGAATPATALYSWNSNTGTATNSKLVWNGTSANPITINSTGNVQSGGFGSITGTNNDGSGQITATWVNANYVGATNGSWLHARLSAQTLSLHDFKCYSCGSLFIDTTLGATATFSLQRYSTPVPAITSAGKYAVDVTGSTARTSGVREILNSVITNLRILGTSGASNGFTVQDVMLSRQFTVNTSPMNMTTGSGMDAFDRVILNVDTDDVGGDFATLMNGGTPTKLYVFRQMNPAGANPHLTQNKATTGNFTMDGAILELTNASATGDFLQVQGDGPSANTFTAKNVIVLPGSSGLTSATVINVQGTAVTYANTKFFANHITSADGTSATGNTLVWGFGGESSPTLNAGFLNGPNCWIGWGAASVNGGIAAYSATATVADGAYVGADYNGIFNSAVSVYRPADAKFATPSPPGTHDQNFSRAPSFADSTRRLMKFDVGYLGHALGTATCGSCSGQGLWDSGTSYNLGDVVYNPAHSTYFASQQFNWRCRATAGCASGANNEPGTGSAYATLWEPASLQYLRDSILAGQTFVDQAANVTSPLSMIGILYGWVAQGYTPLEPSLWGACNDAADIGANSQPIARHIPPPVMSF